VVSFDEAADPDEKIFHTSGCAINIKYIQKIKT